MMGKGKIDRPIKVVVDNGEKVDTYELENVILLGTTKDGTGIHSMIQGTFSDARVIALLASWAGEMKQELMEQLSIPATQYLATYGLPKLNGGKVEV